MKNKLPTELTVQLNVKYKLHRSGDQWALAIKNPNNTDYDIIRSWRGPARSVYANLESLNIQPTREAEDILSVQPERMEFIDRNSPVS